MFAPSQPSERIMGSEVSFADDLDEHALATPPVELAVEDLLPRAEIELAARNRRHYLAPHHLALEVRVPVVLPPPPGCAVLSGGRMERQHGKG